MLHCAALHFTALHFTLLRYAVLKAGYVGEDVESILHKLYMESGQDIERCQRGIVYLDEIDKVGVGASLSFARWMLGCVGCFCLSGGGLVSCGDKWVPL